MSGGRGFLNRTWVLGTVLAFLLLGGTLAANGVQENRVARAKALIAEKNYNDAILILTEVVREEPDRQDEAQELIGQIVRLRNQYNTQYESLIDLLYTKNDEETALKVIAQLDLLDKNPNKQTVEDLKQAKRTARLIANNKRYRDIMARGLALLDRKEYGAAVQVYLEGSDLAKDIFLESGLGNVLTNQVDRAWEDLKSSSAQFVAAESRLKALQSQGTAFWASETGSPSAQDGLLAPLRDLAALRQRAWAAARLFKAQNDFLVKNNRQDDFFLGYSYLFVHGPPDAKSPEGIQGAMDRIWSELLDPWTAQIQASVEARYTQAKAALDQGRYEAAGVSFESLRVMSRRGLDLIALWNRLAGVDETGALDPEFRSRLARLVPLGLWLEHRLTLAREGVQAAKDLPRGAGFVASANLDGPALDRARADVAAQKRAFASFAKIPTDWNTRNQALGALGYAMVDDQRFSDLWASTWERFRRLTLSQEAEFVDRRGTLEFRALDSRFQILQASLADARNLVEGRVKYPLQGVAKLEELRPLQDALVTDVGLFIGTYQGEQADVKTPAVLRWPVQGQDLLGRVTGAQTLQGQLVSVARANYAQSQTLRKQGQDMVTQVNSSVTAENFTLARSTLNQISTRYSQSLTLQEDPAFRTESDTQVKQLFDMILKGENEVVVREVRKLVTQGSQLYLNQQFQQAEQVLLRARSRWATTNADPNSEVEYWLTLSNYALSVTSGRELSPIDPLYNEVQQLLNFARKDFTQGQELLDAGKTADAQELMRQAKEILSKILLPFPQNQEARLLSLEILKASDPANFPTLFKQNFDAAVAKIGVNPTEAYNDLQDYDKIQPNYPGMAGAIKQVRLALRLDREAVDPKVLAEARTLVAQASRLVDGGRPEQLTQAQAQIRRALQLDPTNGQAQVLFDKISLRISGTVATLTPTQVGELNEILDLLRTQRTLEALSRITEFKAKYPAVVNEARVKEAERRIKAVN